MLAWGGSTKYIQYNLRKGGSLSDGFVERPPFLKFDLNIFHQVPSPNSISIKIHRHKNTLDKIPNTNTEKDPTKYV
jgi:hypothetical protein